MLFEIVYMFPQFSSVKIFNIGFNTSSTELWRAYKTLDICCSLGTAFLQDAIVDKVKKKII